MVKFVSQLTVSMVLSEVVYKGFCVFAGYALSPKVHQLILFVIHHPVFLAAIL